MFYRQFMKEKSFVLYTNESKIEIMFCFKSCFNQTAKMFNKMLSN
jgi:hypothetical protein